MGWQEVFSNRWRSRLALIVGLGLSIRLAFVFLIARYDQPVGDQLFYSAQALTNGRGQWFEQPFAAGLPAADHPPLTAAILTPITWLAEASGSFITAQRLMMVAIGTTSIVVVAMIGRLLAGDKVGLWAGALTAVYANVWLNDGLVMAESPTFFLIAVTTLVALQFRRQFRVQRVIILGVAAGALALTRPELPVVAIWLAILVLVSHPHERRVKQRIGDVSILLVTALLVVAPWILWNQSRFTDPVYLSTNDGLTLAGSNCDRTYFEDIGSWDISCAYATEIPVGADASQASSLMRSAGLTYWREHLTRYPQVAGARLLRVLSLGFIESNNRAGQSEGRPMWISMMGVIQFWILGIAAVIGWGRLGRGLDRWILIVLLPTAVVIAMIANAYVRFRLPAELGLLVLAAVGLQQGFKKPQSPKVSFESE